MDRFAEFDKRLKLATRYYSAGLDGANHSKVYIIDEDSFYIGSDNFYASLFAEGLQEFGFLIEDKNETKKFIDDYWSNLWKYSKKHVLT